MATTTETIIWTVVPNGVTVSGVGVGQARLSVHVAPTLAGSGGLTLNDFVTDFGNWPTKVSAPPLQFTVNFFDATNHLIAGSQTPTIDTTVLRPDLWTALFSPPSGVQVTARDPGEPYTDLPVISYPAGKIADWLQQHYANWAFTSPKDFPLYQDLIGVLGNLGYVGQDGQKRLESVLNGLRSERNAVVGGKTKRGNDFSATTDEQAFAALRYYHQPRPHVLGSVPLPTVDFHRALTFIGEHRTLQRALGLVFDITVPLPRGTVAAGATMFVQVTPTFQGQNYTPVIPRTRCTVSTTVFEAQPVSSQIVGRQLRVGDTSSFLVHQVDVDGGGLKTAMFADNVQMSRKPQPGGPPAPDAPQSYAPPSLRSAGITVTAVNRGLGFVSKLDRSADLMKGVPNSVPDLTAEDLVRGFVLDVHDSDGNAWNSTAKRTGVYHSGALPDLASDDEASIDAPPRMASDATDPKQLNLPENLVRWDGWSLAGPRPGVPISDDGGVAPGGVDPGPFSQLQMKIDPKPGTLPRLRFGKTYALRMRVVDIAGNVIDIGAAADVGDQAQRVSTPTPYARHEPIGSPDIYHHEPSIPGESLARLVIRGNYDTESVETSQRTFAPPRSSQLFAEHHGLFDVTSGGVVKLDKGSYPLIVARESAKYDPTGLIPLASPVPYLPDPLSRGGALTITDGPLASPTPVMFDFAPAAGHTWPDYRPHQLVLVAGPAQATSVDAAQRIVTFALSKADRVTLRLSSRPAPSDLPTLGIYRWIVGKFGAPGAAFDNDAAAGQHWALTPYQEVQLVYAVRQPLHTPDFASLGDTRAIGQTFATLRGLFAMSRKSTSKIDLLAHWDEPVDDGPGAPAPSGPGADGTNGRPVDTHVFALTIDAAGLDGSEEFIERHEFHDTKHRNVRYQGNATSRFTEHFAGHVELALPTAGSPVSLSSIGLEPGSVKVSVKSAAGVPTEFAEDVAFTVNPGAGTMTFLGAAPPDGPALGSLVDIDFLPPVSRLTPDAGRVTLNIRSSARPSSPHIRDIVPIYDWAPVVAKGRGKTLTSGRSPSALRIYMERPWWSSGVDELLGVVTWPGAEIPIARVSVPAVATIPKEASLYVSDWGADPVFDGPKLPSAHPRLATFPNSPAGFHGAGLSIEERTDVTVNVAGHPVAYDASRQLWYCDVRVDTGKAYTPMIRLALARYQPNSVGGVELSRIVLADVMSLEPGRTVAVSRKSATLLSSVTLSGYSYTKAANRSGSGPGVAQLQVEARDSRVSDPTLGWSPVGKPVTMHAKTHANGLTTWTATDVHVPKHGKHRLFIEQFEVLPTESRDKALYLSIRGSKPSALRLLYQDMIPL